MTIREAEKLFDFCDRPYGEVDIKRKYRVLAKQFHPDLCGGDSDSMVKLNSAYSVLLGANKQKGEPLYSFDADNFLVIVKVR